MKKTILLLFLSSVCSYVFSANFTVNNSGLTFAPATLTINSGDDVTFVIAANHNAVEVSKAVWDANGSTPIVGFSLPFGGGTVLASQLTVGTHYYVCVPHSSLGMKGTIIVKGATALIETNVHDDVLIYPNPVRDNLNVQFTPSNETFLEIKLFDIQGKLINTLLQKTEVSGLFSRTFSIGKVASPGVYFVQIAVGDKTSMKKVVVL